MLFWTFGRSGLDVSLGIGLSSLEAVLGLLEVDDRPDVLEVVCREEQQEGRSQYISMIQRGDVWESGVTYQP